MSSALQTAGGVVASLVLGAVVGVLGAFHHPSVLTVGGARLPVGVLAGIGALILAQLLAAEAVPAGIGPGLVLAGWTVAVAVLGVESASGDIVIPADAAGEAFLYGGFLVGLVGAGVLAFGGVGRERRSRAAASGGEPTDR